ncbi:cyclic nucleotide-binding domain-containing protein [Burkholderia sp. MS455]|uniref:Crp/Fnr family transcriptional regulator n=1 Tax=Burkholderia sp. MS455 TaxID=2811788 RepID=UPI0019569EE6|nr:helix-turn-helix domain-containing protein [Burkholderia sp. MS455]QRR07569.1 cyclic nucleotide-binding domain-containing protein [Burkholderia sp. MS455]
MSTPEIKIGQPPDNHGIDATQRINHCPLTVRNNTTCQSFNSLFGHERRIDRGTILFRQGDKFVNLYVVLTGSLKSGTATPDGREQVTGLHFIGDIIGLDAICDGIYPRTTIALENCVVRIISYATLVDPVCTESIHAQLLNLMSRQIRQESLHMMLVSTLSAEKRVATFLLNTVTRCRMHGQLSTTIDLNMTREDLGSYLGMTMETVSRSLSTLKRQGLIRLQRHSVHVIDLRALSSV